MFVGPFVIGADDQVVLDGHEGEEPPAFRHMDDAAVDDFLGRQPVNRLAVEGDFSRRRLDQPRDGPQQGGLAGAVAADDAYHLAFLHFEGEIEDHLYVAVEGVDIVDFKKRHTRPPDML